MCVCRVQSEVTDEGKVGRLLDELDRCGPNAFDSFVDALRDTDQPHAVEVLKLWYNMKCPTSLTLLIVIILFLLASCLLMHS